MAVYPASVTPFDAEGRIDLPGFARLLAHFRSTGCRGVILAGTTGEGPSLSAIEKRDLVRAAVPLADGLEVVLGIATPSLDEAAWLANQAAKAGASAALVMPPAYFREATEEGLFKWFESLTDSSPLPLLVYNFPQRTGIRLSPELVARLAELKRVVGLKDSSGDRVNLAAYAAAMPGKRLYTGDETLLMEAIDHGWTGTISGAANVLSEWLVAILQDPEPESAITKFQYLLPGIRALRASAQPAMSKAILKRSGILENSMMRLPLFAAENATVEAVAAELQKYSRH